MGDKQKQQQQQNEQQTFAHFFGNLEDFNSEIKELKDIKIEQNDPFQRERLQIFLGASSTSNIQKKVYKDKVCAVKEMPLIRYFNIKNLINYNENYKYLFEGSEDQEYQASRCGLRLIKKIYQFRIIKDKIPKPLQCVVTSQDSSKMSLNLMMKRTSNIMQFPLNIAFLIVKRVAEALQLLHSKNLCHGNVCPNNIFVSNYIIEDYQSSSQDNQSVYLHDSGMHYLCKWDAQIEKGIKETSSKIKEEDIHVLNEFQFVQRNHIQFIAPELIAWFNPKEKSNTKKKNEGDQQNNNDQQQEITEQTFEPTEKSDIYQLGLCLLCMCNTRDISSILSLLSLKQELQITLIGNKIEELELKQVKDKNRDKIKQLLKQMLEFNPKIRLSAQAVIERADSIYKSLIKKPMNDDGFQEIHDIEQYEMKGFIENFDEYLEYQRQQTIQKLQDVCKVVPNKQNPRSELIKNALNVIDQHIKSTRNFTISMMKSQCKQINENSEKQQLISQINEFNFVHYSQYSQHGYFNMIVLEKNKMIRLNLFDYLIFSEEKTEKQQLESFQYTLNTNENQKKQSLTIQSCIFLDSMSFITLDSQLEMNLWNIDLNKPILSNSLSDFDIQTVQLLNLSQNKIIIYDKFSVKVYNILKDQLSKLPKIFIEKNHDYELRFQEYQIKKLIPLNSPDNLFIVLTQKSQFILCNANSKKYECQFSLMNIPKIQNNYYNEENIIPQADLLISENSYQQIIENQTFQNNSSIIYQNPNQSYIQNQQQMQQLIHSNNIKKQNENSNSLFKKFVSFFKKCNQEPAFEQELKKQIIPDVPLVIILEAKYIYYIKLRDLVFKQFDKISNQQNLPSYGKYVCGIFHPMNKSQILFINDSKELIIYDYISDLAIIKLHFAESLLDLQYFSFEKRNYLVIKDFSNLFISKLDLEYPAEAQNFQKIKSGQIRQVIMFPRCLAQQTGTSVKSSYRNQ